MCIEIKTKNWDEDCSYTSSYLLYELHRELVFQALRSKEDGVEDSLSFYMINIKKLTCDEVISLKGKN